MDVTNIVNLEEKITNLPQKPGVYLYKNNKDKIIYVGKAIKLKNRVKSYFHENRPRDAKTKALIQNICDFETIVTDSEAEALILEDTLIKKHKPKYNVLLKDDKTYPYVKITNELYPQVFVTRNRIKDGSKYIGPITEVYQLKNLMKTLRSLFKIRSCNLDITELSIKNKKHKVCLDYHIKKCDGPCEGLVSSEEYTDNIKNAQKIILGKTKEVESVFNKQMVEESEKLNFEKAARIRNNLLILRDFTSKQKIVSSQIVDRDVFAIARVDDDACTIVLKIREGKLIGKRNFIVKKVLNTDDSEILQRTIEKWYLESEYVPDEVFLPCEPDDFEYLTDWLSELKGKSVKIQIPKIGEKKEMIEMAETNAKYILKDYHVALYNREQIIPRPVLSLQRDLRLEKPPRILECFDNSHLQGTDLVSSLVKFVDGKPYKSGYRKFKNKTVLRNDDFASMKEAVTRRYKNLLIEIEENKKKSEPDPNIKLPDLIIIDGGKGQLGIAVEVLKELEIFDKVKVIGLAKRLEEIFFPNQKEALLLPKTSSSLRVLQQIRDEAHRFAITYHRKIRDKRTLNSELNNVPGLGEKTVKKLLTTFGSVKNVFEASEVDLKKVLNNKQLKSLNKYISENDK